MTFLVDGLFVPAACLALMAWLVPKLVSMMLPEGARFLMVNAIISTFLLFAISTGFFVFLYVWQGMNWAEIVAFGVAANVVFFGKLGLIAGMIWAPFMVLSVAGLPRNWVTKVW